MRLLVDERQYYSWINDLFLPLDYRVYIFSWLAGADPEGGGRTRRAPPLKLGEKKIGVKSWFFTRNTQTNFAPPSAIWRNMIFWRKIVIFHTKYPKNVRASLRSAQFFKCAPPPNLKSWIRPWLEHPFFIKGIWILHFIIQEMLVSILSSIAIKTKQLRLKYWRQGQMYQHFRDYD